MINLYAYTYPHATKLFPGYIVTKVGDTHRDPDVRMDEQGGAAELEEKIKIGRWLNLQKIQRDHDVHKILEKQGLRFKRGSGTEWFRIPANSIDDVRNYIDQVVTKLEGKKIRRSVTLRDVQKKNLDKAMEYIEKSENVSSIIANLCPRFGKTIWALSLFNRISEKYGNKVMLLPAYWLSVHSSFVKELDSYDDFSDIALIDTADENANDAALEALDAGYRIVVPISLHGDLEPWKIKHKWIADIPNETCFVFADEGDFGTHTENQIAKLNFLFNE